MKRPTEPFDVILALRALHFAGPDELAAWINRPNADLDGLSVARVVLRGRYDDAILAITLEAGRRGVETYHPELLDEG